MKRKTIKKLLLLVIVTILCSTYPMNIYALADPSENPSAWEPKIDNNPSIKYKTTVNNLLGYINVIGIVISVVVLMILGIKYLLGSIEEKAEYKKTMLGYFIGALILFSVTTIANILYNIGTSF